MREIFVATLLLLNSLAAFAVTGPQAKADSLSDLGTDILSEVGGSPVRESKLRAVTVSLNGNGLCTGAYIGNGRIVTAGHCLLAGQEQSVDFVTTGTGYFNCPVVAQAKYPNYKSTEDIEFDIAVVRVDCPQARALTPFKLATQPPTAEKLLSAGYGMTDTASGTYTFPDLNSLPLTQFDYAGPLPGKTPAFMHDIKILEDLTKSGQIASFKVDMRHTPFFGDSGGPVYAQNADGTYTLFGLVGDLIPAKANDINSIFLLTSPGISFFRSWILKQ